MYAIALLMNLVLVPALSSQPQLGSKGIAAIKGERGPVTITSQRLEAEYAKRLITYTGEVVATHKDFTLRADRLSLVIAPDGTGVEKIVAQGNVRMLQGQRTVTCQQATYYYAEGRLTLGGTERVKITILPEKAKR